MVRYANGPPPCRRNRARAWRCSAGSTVSLSLVQNVRSATTSRTIQNVGAMTAAIIAAHGEPGARAGRATKGVGASRAKKSSTAPPVVAVGTNASARIVNATQ